MKKLLLTTIIYSALLTYPAYVQTASWVNQTLDAWAADRVGLSAQAASDYATVAEALPEHLQEPLPVPGKKP